MQKRSFPYETNLAPLQNNWKIVTIANPTVLGGKTFETMMAKCNFHFCLLFPVAVDTNAPCIFDPPKNGWTLQCLKSVGCATIVGSA